MLLTDLKDRLPGKLYDVLVLEQIKEMRPSQEKSIQAGLLGGKNLLVCTPTASGKTLIAELAALSAILNNKTKAVYIVPLRSLASEKYKDFKRKYGTFINVKLAMGDIDSPDPQLQDADFIICTAEKLDSLLRHHAPWVQRIGVVIADEIHLLNDPGRGPTLEILLTMLKKILPKSQFISLSATIGNQKELAAWLDAELVVDDWRPVKLHKGVYLQGEIEFT